MQRWEAEEASVTLEEALLELRRHGVSAVVDEDNVLRERETGDLIAYPNKYNEYAGSEILAFLGY